MPIFYLDSGSIDRLEISSSLLVSGSFTVSGSMNTTGGLTGSLFGTASWAVNAVSASYAPGGAGLSGGSTNVIPLWTSPTTLGNSYISQSTGILYTDFSGDVTGLYINSGDGFYWFGSTGSDNAIIIDLIGAVKEGIQVKRSGQGLFTDSGITTIGDYDNIINSTKIIVDDTTQTTFISGSIYNSGSLTVDVGNTLNLLSAGGFIGTQNNYIELYAQNLSAGVSASTDIVAYANNGSETSSFIDMGINSSGMAVGYSFGNANDAYVYNSGGNLFIGNNTAFYQSGVSEQALFLFANASGSPDLTITGSRVGIGKTGSLNSTLDVNGSVTITGSVVLTGGSGFSTLLAAETLAAGDIVNVYSGGVRKASSTDTTKQAHGFVTSSYSATNPVIVFYSGLLTGVTGLTAGARYFLSASGAESNIPPSTTGQLSQEIGVATSTTSLLFQPGPAIIT